MIQDDNMQIGEMKGVLKTDTGIFWLDFQKNDYVDEEIKITIIAQMYFIWVIIIDKIMNQFPNTLMDLQCLYV